MQLKQILLESENFGRITLRKANDNRIVTFQMNGFPNGFYGWGGEDDELAQRTNQTQLTITRQAGNIARYTMLKHDGVCNIIATNQPK